MPYLHVDEGGKAVLSLLDRDMLAEERRHLKIRMTVRRSAAGEKTKPGE